MSYCAYGAIAHVMSGREFPGLKVPMPPVVRSPAVVALQLAIGGWSIGGFNDTATHEELIDAFDRAILSLAPETQPEPLEAVSA
jgi:hypothetical protein